MFFLSGKGCSEFPKRMLISIGILKQVGGITISREEALANYYEDIDEDELDGSDVPNVC